MATVNIDRRSIDPYNRYQMPKIVIQNQGSATILVNISNIGKSLHRPTSCTKNDGVYLLKINIFFSSLDITKFFSYEFSVPIRWDTKKKCDIMSGRHERETLENALDRFIEHFVLCSECGNPETELVCYP
jgi:translation initiation factor 5